MYLKSIEIQGFKSFANKTVFQFHNGITGIVGPNGSGKSNVADAVRWVLGEQRIRQLRGGTMQDVIFAGTQSRKAMGSAYVAITLNNSDHVLPVSYDEVTIARRLYRSGESEYLINGTVCRLKDVNELFYDTGIGKEGYSIIGQGQVEKILSGKPEERRELFDEAAGIVKFKRRKAEAVRKLENEQQNLIRVHDILSELGRQLGPLERQSEKAKTYLRMREEMKAYDVNLFLTEYQEVKERLEKIAGEKEIAEEELGSLQEEAASMRKAYESASEELKELTRAQDDLQSKLTQSKLDQKSRENRVAILEEQLRSAASEQARQEERMTAVRKDLMLHREDLGKILSALDDLETHALELSGKDRSLEKEYRLLRQQIEGLVSEQEKLQQQRFGMLEERTSIRTRQQHFETMMEQIRIRRSELNQQMLLLSSTDESQQAQADKLQEDLGQLAGQIQELTDQSNRAGEELSLCQETLTEGNQKLEREQALFHRESSRLESLKNIAERYDGYNNSIRRVMEKRDQEKGLLGVVADLIKTEQKYETAIETALGTGIQNIVTEDEDTAKRMIRYLKQNRFGRSTFLPLTALKGKQEFSQPEALKQKGVIGLASELISYEAKYRGLARHLLGRTLVVDNMDNAAAIAGKYHYTLRIVTLEGELLSPGGSMTGGAFKNSSNLLGRRREIEELERSVLKKREELDSLKQIVDTSRSRRNELRDQIRNLSEQLQQLYLRQNTLKVQLQEMQRDREQTDTARKKTGREVQDIADQIRETEDEQSNLTGLYNGSLEKEKELEKQENSLQSALDDARSREREMSASMEKLHVELEGCRQKTAYLEQEQQRLENETALLEEEEKTLSAAGDTREQDAASKQEEIGRIRLQMQEGVTLEQELEKENDLLTEHREEMNRKQKQLFDQQEDLSSRTSLMDRECMRLTHQMEKLEENRENSVSYMWDEYELTYSSALPLKREDLGSRTSWKKNMAQLKKQIRDLGSVNVGAIEEYKEVKERHTFLSGQHDDLIRAQAALEKIIKELDDGMRSRFREQFERISAEFDKSFKQLFGGGTGTLQLVEEEDILEAGIRVIAQPPGKKLQNMMQLSGGEKSLTAIALLFAIQNLKPSPFCLLDEIEAALDENNVERYAGYLHKLTKNTQFIIITHRRGTMTAADRLYGITMQEKGISSLVSVSLVERELDD